MTHPEARALVEAIEKSGMELTLQETKLLKDIRQRFAGQTKISSFESRDLQWLYRRTAGGGYYQKRAL